MSTLKTEALRGLSGSADSIQLHASNQSVTFPGAVTITGALTSSTTTIGPKILQIVNKVWTTEDNLSNSFTANKYDQSITTVGANSNWIFLAQPARMLLKANSEIKARVNESTNDIGDERREWRNYTSSDSRPGCTAIWYYDWSLAAGATVTMSLQWYSNSTDSTVGDGGQNSNFIIIEVAA